MAEAIRKEIDSYTQEMMRLAVEAPPNGTVMANREGEIVLVNRANRATFWL